MRRLLFAPESGLSPSSGHGHGLGHRQLPRRLLLQVRLRQEIHLQVFRLQVRPYFWGRRKHLSHSFRLQSFSRIGKLPIVIHGRARLRLHEGHLGGSRLELVRAEGGRQLRRRKGLLPLGASGQKVQAHRGQRSRARRQPGEVRGRVQKILQMQILLIWVRRESSQKAINYAHFCAEST